MIPDGNFSTVKFPNPEEIESFEIALEIASRKFRSGHWYRS